MKPKETNFKILGQTKGCLGRTKSWYELDRGEVLEGEVDGQAKDQVEAHEQEPEQEQADKEDLKEQESLKHSSSCSSQEASSYPSTIIFTPE